MDRILSAVIMFVIGGGLIALGLKSRRIVRLEEQNRDLAKDSAESRMEGNKANQRADAAIAGKKLTEKAYEASVGSARESTESSTPLSEEDRKLAEAIMDHHRD